MLALAADDVDISVGGFVRADIGFGDRYGDAAEEDRIGVSKTALAVTAVSGNNSAVLVIGAEADSVPNSNNLGDVGIKDAFIVLDKFLAENLTVSLGAQPLLVGLKPNGYPGDRSINTSIEYGAGGAFAVSNQAGPSVIANFSINESHDIRFGFFDRQGYNNDVLNPEGSSISDNLFIQWRGTNLGGSGVYAIVAYEMIYVGGAANDSDDIVAAGVGWGNEVLDLSFEYNMLGSSINATADDESYMIAEATFNLSDDLLFYLDYSMADEMDFTTIRLGTNFYYDKHTMFSAEIAEDEPAIGDSISSIDFRVSFDF
ncbi:MAG: hypothetical protein HRU20_00385 [Pseudomonadales bacterium]|nr:hypothetical protein [Pseudomonadales bacterium]